MSLLRVVVLGVGGHGRELAAIAKAAGHDVVAFLDHNVESGSYEYGDVIGRPETVERKHPVLLGIGMPAARQLAHELLSGLGWTDPPPILHPASSVGPRVALQPGVMIGSNSSITADASVGKHTHLHSSVVISHDCSVGSYCLVSPRAALAGDVQVGDGVFLGVGATISPGVTIGNGATVGAGAVVLNDVEPNTVVAGVPARPIHSRK